MNILIICTYFRPDTAIAAKRPYMFAKHLSELGHSVTVIWSGRISEVLDQSFKDSDFDFTLISYSGGIKVPGKVVTKQNFEFLPLPVFNFLVRVVKSIKRPLKVLSALRIQRKDLRKIKAVIDNMDSSRYDIVFTTYGELANIPAGKYAKEKFGCKWVLDFRDRLVQPGKSGWLWCLVFSRYEKKILNEADVITAVSEDLFNGVRTAIRKHITIYNGYSSLTDNELDIEQDKVFSICYSGTFYPSSVKGLHALFSELSLLVKESCIDVNLLKFNFMGRDGEMVKKIASNYGLQTIVNDYGYVPSLVVSQIQNKTDLFLVFSENTSKYQGIMTGKFYEGIQCGKPILTIVYGDTPNCELYRLNETYHYGFCYETCNDSKQKSGLRNFLLSLYKSKIANDKIEYSLRQDLKDKFEYKNLTKELEQVFYDAIASK